MSDKISTHAATLSRHQEEDSKTTFGFWIYLMTDAIVFASLFAVYAVLRNNTNGGPDGQELFSLPFILVETLILLVSSFTVGLAMLAVHRHDKRIAIIWLSVTLVLGMSFLAMEITEFTHLVQEGHSWRQSAFLSSFFTLVGTHGLHILVGILWLGVMIAKVIKEGLGRANTRKLTLLAMFWHFLDVVWIFIFSIVYLIGAV